ncbi:hypothetical protein EZV62_026980 [Acer yangbiense]|uniref:Uncharacterized protein n=1 Tax=Acer yangbiense TaxID=1000413 RepID=A0A5C7GU97_9ROSI|nr:hypothetical protein EZV62_026980 [Acer yangbiense]
MAVYARSLSTLVCEHNESHCKLSSFTVDNEEARVAHFDGSHRVERSKNQPKISESLVDYELVRDKSYKIITLVARASANEWNEGRFYLSVTFEGLFAFYKSDVPRMYLNFTVYGIKESEQPSYIRSVNDTLALYMLSAEPSEPDVVLSRPVDNTAIGYMRFDSDEI